MDRHRTPVARLVGHGAALVLAVAGLAVAPAAAQPAPTGSPGPAADPTCAPEVAGLPLTVDPTFSGTVRTVADDDGGVTESRLRCAYGDGATPAVDLTLVWAPGEGCGTLRTERADGVEAGPVEAAGVDLLGAVGGPCPDTDPGSDTTGVVALAIAATGAAVALVALRRRRGRRVVAPTVDHVPPSPAGPAAPVAGPVDPPTRAAAAGIVADALSGRAGRRLARRPAGLLLAGAALAHARDASGTAALAVAAARRSDEVRVPAGQVLQDVVTALGHDEEVGAP